MSEGSIQLSVVIPTWNALGLTSRAVEHLNRDGYPDWAELIVVNDGSDDGTSTHLRTLFPRLTVIDHATNRGFGAAVNTGFVRLRAASFSEPSTTMLW